MPLWRLLEYVRITFPAEGQRQRDTGCDLFTLSLRACDFDDGLVTGVTFDCFAAVYSSFWAVKRLWRPLWSLCHRLRRYLHGLRGWFCGSERLPYFDDIGRLNAVSCG